QKSRFDTNKLNERIKATVKSKGKTRTVMKTVIRLVDGDFTWKDPKAAERAGMSLKDYVIGGMDRAFKGRLYRLFRALDEAGLAPGMTATTTGNRLQPATMPRATAHITAEVGAAAMAAGLQPTS